MSEEKSKIHAHRGGRAEFDENTLVAFQGSYERGLRGFETDVRMSSDDVLVIMHDDSIERTTEGTGAVEDLTAAELRRIRTKAGNPVLFLDDLLGFLADKPGLYVELEMKTDPDRYPSERLAMYCRTLYETVLSRMADDATIVFTSFDTRPLTLLRELRPDADLMYITSAPCCDETIREALDLGVPRLSCTWDGSSRASVRKAHEAGLVLAGWPGRTVEDHLLGIALDFDHLCADNPVEVLEFRRRHLSWLT